MRFHESFCSIDDREFEFRKVRKGVMTGVRGGGPNGKESISEGWPQREPAGYRKFVVLICLNKFEVEGYGLVVRGEDMGGGTRSGGGAWVGSIGMGDRENSTEGRDDGSISFRMRSVDTIDSRS